MKNNYRPLIIITLTLIALIAIIVPAYAIHTDNDNLDFEHGDLSHWRKFSYQTLGTYIMQVVPGAAHEGTYSLSSTYYKSGATIRYESIYLDGLDARNHTNVTFWYKLPSGTTLSIWLCDDGTQNTGAHIASSSLYTYDDAWHKIVLNFSAGEHFGIVEADVLHSLCFRITRASDGTSIGYLDDIRIDDVPSTVAPIADFTGSPLAGEWPLSVSFTDISSGVPTSWQWIFGDGLGTSNDQNPHFTFERIGFYNVSLQVTNAMGSDWENKTYYIASGYQAGSFSGGFSLTYNMTLDPGYTYQGAEATIHELSPGLVAYDNIIWYIDGQIIPDSDVPGWIGYKEAKNISGTWKEYNPSTHGWDTSTPTGILLNSYHFHTNGDHIIGAKIYNNSLLISDLYITISTGEAGLYSNNNIYVRNSNGALIQNVKVNCTDLATLDVYNWTFALGFDQKALIKGHSYTFMISATGYTTLTEIRTWPQVSGSQFATFVLYNESIVPYNLSNVYAHVRITTNADQYGLPNPLPGAWITITSASSQRAYQVDDNGNRDIELAKNTYYTYVATTGGYEPVSGSFTTGTTNYDLPVVLPRIIAVITPTPAPYTPTAQPTAPGGGYYPAYPEYNDAERNNIIEGSVDKWIGALPGLLDLVILVCFFTLIGYINITPRKRR